MRKLPVHNPSSSQIKDGRKTAAQRGYGYRWQKARLVFLDRNPLCVHCMQDGRTEPATVVDHKIPHKGDYGLMWDRSNWQPLCERHHNIKTASQDGGFGREIRKCAIEGCGNPTHEDSYLYCENHLGETES